MKWKLEKSVWNGAERVGPRCQRYLKNGYYDSGIQCKRVAVEDFVGSAEEGNYTTCKIHSKATSQRRRQQRDARVAAVQVRYAEGVKWREQQEARAKEARDRYAAAVQGLIASVRLAVAGANALDAAMAKPYRPSDLPLLIHQRQEEGDAHRAALAAWEAATAPRQEGVE